MAGIDEFLKQNPQLIGEDPIDIAGYVYDTQIRASGANRAEFEEYFLGAPIKSETFFGAEADDTALTKFGKSVVNGIGDMVKGDAEFDIDSASSLNATDFSKAGLKTAAASVLGDDKDYEAALMRQYPDATFHSDKNGNRYMQRGKSVSGRTLYDDGGGNQYSEKTVTFPLNGKWITFPSVDESGNIMSEDDVSRYVEKNGPIDPITREEFPVFNSENEATEYAKKRSETRLDNKYYINQPGLDAEDITRLGGKMLAFIPSAKIAGAVGKAAGFGYRVLTGGAAAAATDAGMQKASGREEIDGGQVALTGALGAGAEAIAPAIGKLVGKIAQRFGVDKWSRMSATQQQRAIATQLSDDGFKPADFGGMSKAQVIKIGRERVKQAGLVKPEATIAGEEFGYKMTKGQMMPADTAKRRAAKFAQVSKEEMLKSTDSGQRFRDVDLGNVAKTDENISRMGRDMSGGVSAQADTSMEAAGLVHEGLRRADVSLKSKVNAAYDTAKGFKANMMADAAREVPDRVTRALESADVVLDDLTPAGRGALKLLRDAADSMNVPNGKAKDVPIQQIERMRRRVATFYDKASTPEDRRAVQVIKGAYDDALDEAIDAQMFTGDSQALDALKSARKLHADYSRKFRGKDEAGKVVQKMLDIDATPEQVANYMVGVNGLTKAGAARVAKRYGEIVGVKSEEYDALREMLLYTITRKPTGETKGGQALVSTLKKAMDGQGSSLIKELYTESEQASLKRFTRALEATLPEGDFAKSSGTAERMLRFYQSGGFKEFPGMKLIIGLLDNSATNKALTTPIQQANPISVLPAAGAFSTSQ